jgi:transcription elongation GreA/GreB family factor
VTTPNPGAVRGAHQAYLQSQLSALKESAEAAQDAMRVDGDHRPDSRGERGAVSAAGALRAGLLERAAAIETSLGHLAVLAGGGRRRVAPGALVQIDDGVAERWLAVLPGGDGRIVQLGATPVTVVSPSAPLVRAVWGMEEGDAAELRRPGGDAEIEVVRVL